MPVRSLQQSAVAQSCWPHSEPAGDNWQAGHCRWPSLLTRAGLLMAPFKCRPMRAVSHDTSPAVHPKDFIRVLTALMALAGA